MSTAYREEGAIVFSLGFRIEFFAYLPAIGFGFAAMAMMGQNMGAGNIKRAKESFRTALIYGFLGAAGLGLLALLFAPSIIHVFTRDPTVIEYAKSYMGTVVLSYGFLAALMVEASAFQAIGRSWPGFWIFFIRVFLLSVPLSYFLAQVLGFPIISVWFAIIVGNVISAAVGYVWINHALENLGPEDVPVHAEHFF